MHPAARTVLVLAAALACGAAAMAQSVALSGMLGGKALVMVDGSAFDPAAFWALAMKRLPRYAAPLFLRLNSTADMTGNYKLRKVDLQREGFDAALVNDPLWVRDDAAQTYVPLTAAAVTKALSG